MIIKAKDLKKTIKARAQALVSGKGRLLTFALLVADPPAPESPVTVRAFYGAVGDNGEPAVFYQEELL